jgi:hypothetical protein
VASGEAATEIGDAVGPSLPIPVVLILPGPALNEGGPPSGVPGGGPILLKCTSYILCSQL